MSSSPLSDEQLAALPVSYGTAMGMLERGGIARAETVLVTGASGGVGLALVQLAAARGAEVIAVTQATKAPAVRAAGAHHVIDRNAADIGERIAELAPTGLDAVADVAGGPQLTRLIPLVRDGGRWVIAGAIGGPVVEFDLRRLYLHNIALIGSSMHTRAHFAALVGAARAGSIRPRVASTHPLVDIEAAQREFRSSQHIGKLIITVE